MTIDNSQPLDKLREGHEIELLRVEATLTRLQDDRRKLRERRTQLQAILATLDAVRQTQQPVPADQPLPPLQPAPT